MSSSTSFTIQNNTIKIQHLANPFERAGPSVSINGFYLTGADCDTAWKLVLNRYNKRDQIIDEYLRKFTNLEPPKSTTSGAQIIMMVNSANQLLRVLPNFGLNVTDWDAWIMFQLKEKLNSALHTNLLEHTKIVQTIPLAEFLEFLELQAAEHAMNMQTNRTLSLVYQVSRSIKFL